ncbi:MAG: hypothetical protein CMJ78_23270 [Planctomycetaceae bacterium]|nr:hypothetical protein [Planctomycetaceae bacterium]
MKLQFLSLHLLLATLLLGCQETEDNTTHPVSPPVTDSVPADPAPPTKTSTGSESEGLLFADKIKFKNDAGDTLYSLKPKDDGAKLVDADENELVRFNLDGKKLKIKDASDNILGWVITTEGKYKIEDAAQETELFKLQQQADGDWKLEDGQGQLIYKIKLRDYGFELEDPSETSLYKIKRKDDKTSIRNAADETVVSTKDEIVLIAMACLAFDAVDDLNLRAGLATLVLLNE